MKKVGSYLSAYRGMVLLLGLAGCYIGVNEEEDGDSNGPSRSGVDRTIHLTGPSSEGERCQLYEDRRFDRYWICHEDESSSSRWSLSCEHEGCRSTRVYVHYMLDEELGDHAGVQVEAFSNPHFSGAPEAAVSIADFRARPGEWVEKEIYLSPGEYYLRAYMTNQSRMPAPYEFGGMELVADKPVGVFGALSGPQTLQVGREPGETDPVHIYLDQLFKDPDAGPGTSARLRIHFELAESVVAPDRRQIIIELRDSNDLAMNPTVSFSMPSESLLVSGREGRADFLSPEIATGSFTVFAFIDNDNDGEPDDNELQAVYGETTPLFIEIAEDRTEAIRIQLAGGSESP